MLQSVEPLNTYKGHINVVEDVVWHYSRPNTFASVGDDKLLIVWDEREPGNPAQKARPPPARLPQSNSFCYGLPLPFAASRLISGHVRKRTFGAEFAGT